MKAFLRQTVTELRLTLSRPESLLVAFGIPVAVLAFFGSVDLGPPRAGGDTGLTVSVLAVSVMASAMVSLGIATGFERRYRVLKRLGSTPLGRPRLLAAKITATLVIEVLQIFSLIMFAIVRLDANTYIHPLWMLAAVVLGTSAFAGIGLLLAGTLRAEANLAICNALFLLLLLTSGAVVAQEKLPPLLEVIGRLGPVGPLSDAFRLGVSSGPFDFLVWLKLGLWAVLAPAFAAVSFRWE